MDAPPAAAVPKPCCVCDAPNGKHCTKCKSRHYCGKACQIVDWKRGHKACNQLAADFQDRLLDTLMPLKIKEAPPIAEVVAPAAGLKAAARLSAVRTMAAAKASALDDDAPVGRGTCAICLDVLPDASQQIFYECCCKLLCEVCSNKCDEYDTRCPLCRAPAFRSGAEWVRRVQKHVDKGNADAQMLLADAYCNGRHGLKQNPQRAFQLLELSAAQGQGPAEQAMGLCHELGHGVTTNYTTAALWYRRAAEQGLEPAQTRLGDALYKGRGVVQSHAEAVKWWRLAAAQGDANALFKLGVCYANSHGVPRDLNEALRYYKRAAAKGYAGAAAAAERLVAHLAATRPR